MQKRKLGQTDIDVSVLGLGTVKFGRNQGVKYPEPFSIPDDRQLESLLTIAKELGINLLDTAPAYGTSEERVGKLIKGTRKDWVISTKVGEEFVNGESQFDFSRAATTTSIERSLKRLGTDYLDVVLIHSNGDDEKIMQSTDVFATLADLKDQGKIRAFGMSTKTVAGGIEVLNHSDLAMVTYYPGYTDEIDVIRHAEKQQKGILIKKALASGV